jgi:catechol 2,3-dioxygenase-like lactoylglutathione lyase family enzyme
MATPHEAASSGQHPAQLPPDFEPTGSSSDARGPRLASVVVFVHDHDASADFYGELLNMEVTVRTALPGVPTGRGLARHPPHGPRRRALIEGRDPSGLPVLMAYPGPDEVARLGIISRYYV